MYHLTMLATPSLIETKGNIVNVSSVNGIRSVRFFWGRATLWSIVEINSTFYSSLDWWLTTSPRQQWINSLVAWLWNWHPSKSDAIV